MPEVFLQLSRGERAAILQTLAGKLGRTPQVLEKDVWVCWALQELFSMPDRLQMAFKGGTSLSKVFGAIRRFSEDVDITLDYRALAPQLDPFAPGLSKTGLKKLAKQLRERVREHTTQLVRPHIEARLSEQVSTEPYSVEVDNAGEKVYVTYPSALGNTDDYVGDIVLLEFGGRNLTEPRALHTIHPDIAAELPDLLFPEAVVDTLAPERTFWEKATLLHAECNRGELRESAERLSRHWYDLTVLADQQIGSNALQNRALFEDVVKHKKLFFDAPYADYDACLNGGIHLIPPKQMLIDLNADYQKMIAAGMFYETPVPFKNIIQKLTVLENRINR